MFNIDNLDKDEDAKTCPGGRKNNKASSYPILHHFCILPTFPRDVSVSRDTSSPRHFHYLPSPPQAAYPCASYHLLVVVTIFFVVFAEVVFVVFVVFPVVVLEVTG